MFKTPKMTNNQITQHYRDGVVYIYSVSDSAEPGYQPVPTLSLKRKLRYAELRLGLQRYVGMKQINVEVQRVVRVPAVKGISPQDVAITEDGIQYRIEMTQYAPPSSLDLTLERLEQNYEVV